MKKFWFAITMIFLLLSNCSIVSADNNNVNSNSSSFEKVYQIGVNKGILNSQNMPESEFNEFCKDVLFPDYLAYSTDNPGVTFEEYASDENYGVPRLGKDDHPVDATVRGEKSSIAFFTNLISAKTKYTMKAGDILICYGKTGINNSLTTFPGHAAIATSSKYILEMPGTKNYSASHNAHHVTKKAFFEAHTKGSDYVAVYRIKNHPHYASDAASYAYWHMYVDGNPTYSIPKGYQLYVKSPSYCSKYVYYAYWKGATAKSVNSYPKFWWIRPHNLMNDFSSSFKPSYVYRITSY